MKTMILFFFALSALLAQMPPIGSAPPHPPNGYPDNLRVVRTSSLWTETWCEPQWDFSGGGWGVVGANKVHVRMTITPIPTTGWHGHAGTSTDPITGAQISRPAPILRSYSPRAPGDTGSTYGYAVTDFTGCAKWNWLGPGYSGWYLVLITPLLQEPCPVGCILKQLDFTPQGYNIYLGESDPNPAKSHNFTSVFEIPPILIGTDYGSNDQTPDPRHTNHSRYGTIDAWRKVAVMELWYKGHSQGKNLYLYRSTGPSGGTMDNQTFAPAFAGYLLGEWQTQLTEIHRDGNGFDFRNPSPGDPVGFAPFESAVTRASCQFGRRDQNGNPITFTGPSSYWISQPIVHVNCGPEFGPLNLDNILLPF